MPTRAFGFEASAPPVELCSGELSISGAWPKLSQVRVARTKASHAKSRYAPCSMTKETAQKPRRAVAAAVQRPSVSDQELEASLTELRQLAKTLGFEVVHTFTQKRAGFDSAGYFGVR